MKETCISIRSSSTRTYFSFWPYSFVAILQNGFILEFPVNVENICFSLYMTNIVEKYFRYYMDKVQYKPISQRT